MTDKAVDHELPFLRIDDCGAHVDCLEEVGVWRDEGGEEVGFGWRSYEEAGWVEFDESCSLGVCWWYWEVGDVLRSRGVRHVRLQFNDLDLRDGFDRSSQHVVSSCSARGKRCRITMYPDVGRSMNSTCRPRLSQDMSNDFLKRIYFVIMVNTFVEIEIIIERDDNPAEDIEIL